MKVINFSLSSNDHNIVVNNPISIACVVILSIWFNILYISNSNTLIEEIKAETKQLISLSSAWINRCSCVIEVT